MIYLSAVVKWVRLIGMLNYHAAKPFARQRIRLNQLFIQVFGV